ncbi:MAG TPA: DNA-directed RNA polymerase subunit P [Candidatus Nanoarchaeia archaeon]|nr:DNA-directed RNA polymerase subunit P [Candidatus Nanoarchaeia archaeon]
MVLYKCFDCDKVVKQDYIKKKIRCPHCGSKILFKPRIVTSKVEAR